MTYTIIGKTIIIKKKEEVKNTGSPEVASPIDVKGRVVNEKGEPVEGVTVTVKGTKIATATDANGEFSLKMVDQNATLVFTSVNMERFEVNVNGQAELLINLKTKVSTLQDVVINKGYYSTSQRLNTGNVSRVTAETISEQPVGNPLEALQGRIPGFYIQQSSGIPGGALVVQLRGRYSLAGISPFYIIDGVPFTNNSLASSYLENNVIPSANPLNSINPGDIESIEVLKDADATAIYGSRGAGGVVLITTKKGKAGKIKEDINLYRGIGKVSRMMDLLNTEQYLQMRREAFKNDNAVPDPTIDFDLTSWDTTRYTDWQKV